GLLFADVHQLANLVEFILDGQCHSFCGRVAGALRARQTRTSHFIAALAGKESTKPRLAAPAGLVAAAWHQHDLPLLAR
ncbi:MAG TPA: hypothetical protein VNF74_14095, partial [Terriglobales bacterium]|nr:hypothetical protein [Terriglobales bacterium]